MNPNKLAVGVWFALGLVVACGDDGSDESSMLNAATAGDGGLGGDGGRSPCEPGERLACSAVQKQTPALVCKCVPD